MSGDYSDSQHIVYYNNDGMNLFSQQDQDLIFPGDIDAYLSVDESSDWVFAGDFTVELFRVQFPTLGNRRGLISHYNGGGDQRSWFIDFYGDESPKKLKMALSLNGIDTTLIEAEFTPIADTPYDICYERSGTTVRCYVDGVMLDSDTFAGTVFDSDQSLEIGRGGSKSSNQFDGKITAVRITKDVARYGTDTTYIVPSLPLPAGAEPDSSSSS